MLLMCGKCLIIHAQPVDKVPQMGIRLGMASYMIQLCTRKADDVNIANKAWATKVYRRDTNTLPTTA
jgi:hypothetical protein